MRAKQVVLTLALITAGAVIARPDDVLPLASRLAAPLMTHRDAAPADTVAPSLPNFVNTPHELSFPSDMPAAASVTQEAAVTSSPAATPAVAGVAAVTAAVAPDAASVEVAPVAHVDPAAEAASDPTGDKSAALPTDLPMPAAPPEAKSVAPDTTKIIAAKTLFGAVKGPSLLQARSIGSYARGCLAGAERLPVDGPAWQAMRLSRNRNWGHPKLVDLIERFAKTAQKEDGWPGLLVGDLSQPRGGPMLSGHRSHQLGLDADVWLTPMPNWRLSNDEREKIAATSMLDKTDLAVDPKVFTEKHVQLIKRAASYPEVERVLVHPAIKKALCQAAGTDRAWLGKVRPIQGHYYHMHIRIGCPAQSAGCMPQKPPTGEDGCTKEVDDWLKRMAVPAKPPVPIPSAKPRPPPLPMLITQLPEDCRMVLESGADGIAIPPEALVLPPRPKQAHDKRHKAPKYSAVTLKPAKDRRTNRDSSREAHAR